MAEKERADVALVKRGLCESREKAQANIMAGLVYIGQRKVLKASDPVKPEDELILRGKANPFVSRGGLKLEKAIAAFDGTVSGRVCMDIGAAAGGIYRRAAEKRRNPRVCHRRGIWSIRLGLA